MKAIRLVKTGGPEVLQYMDVSAPVAGPGEVLVKAHTIGVGKPDALWRTGKYRWLPPLPATPGIEMTGTIEGMGPGVASKFPDLAVGQMAMVYALKGGCYAEYAAVPATDVVPLPTGIDLEGAICLPNYLVAHALIHRATGQLPGRSVFVNGAGGGMGTAIIQLCKSEGRTVYAGASTDEKCAFARSQGADQAINYSRENARDRVLELTGGLGVELVLDQLGGPKFIENLDMLADLGMVVSFNALAGVPEENLFKELRARLPRSPAVRCFTMHSYDRDPAGRRHLTERVIALFMAKSIRPHVTQRLPLAEARRAHELIDAGAVMGKLVLQP